MVSLVGEEGLEPSLPFGKRFFPTTTAFAAGSKGAVRGPDHLFAHGITRCGRAPSGLYTFLRQDRRLGSGLACRLRRQPPPNLRRSTPGVSPGALNMVGMRPSRLPVPPLARMRLSNRVPPRSTLGAEPMIAQDRTERGARGRAPRSKSGFGGELRVAGHQLEVRLFVDRFGCRSAVGDHRDLGPDELAHDAGVVCPAGAGP
jgi:hypothetical protein